MEPSAEEIKEWYYPPDFMIGKSITILGKKFLLYVTVCNTSGTV